MGISAMAAPTAAAVSGSTGSFLGLTFAVYQRYAPRVAREGLDAEDLPAGRGWHKLRVFGHVAYASRSHGLLWLALRVGNIPIGVPFSAQGNWGLIDVEDALRNAL